MAENHRPNPAFDKESVRASLKRVASSSVLNFCCDDSVIMQHGIFTLLVETLNSLIQAKYQSNKASPSDSHDVIMPLLLVAIFTYATASVAEVMLLARESPSCTLAGNIRLFAGALAAISLLSILDPTLGFITSAVWPVCLWQSHTNQGQRYATFLRPASRNLIDIFTRLAAGVSSRREQPNQQRV